ncbi:MULTISPECIES: AAA family ATPase [Dietzia]|uniref:DNA repair exonuclease SbcCD ATPase subunit n=1 Tax=Dietzia cinnamea TaxID=321318 RepID=A0A4R3ZW66_9ACTN|nr:MULTISPECIES: AAA family ATPase [Dietzia]KZO58782.1 chromosome partitioning protein [Dietzia maris]MCT2057481.1 AAA family ATPase [Dietzia cinnamea]MCT2060695.1 AAA family ATPase [Dietzia cinnamea]MCT2098346.1 AAA family ATPase [Dietzia cinnamea]MCT2120192.1 AAA family ATPase [Dietzia cinnamea]
MILHRLMLEDFRGVVREEVELEPRGVLVIEGPNESGKTSLMDALEMLLEHKASSGRAEIKAASPVGRDVPVVVEAEFTVDGQRMRYRKEFVRGKRTSLEFAGSTRPALSGDDAHDHVRDLLDRQVDRSLWKALRIAQDEPLGQVDAAKGMGSLRRALDAAAGGEDPTGDDSLMDRVAEERNRYLTARRGEPTGELARSETRLAEARAALSEARARHAELDAAVTDHEAQASVHRARQESLTTLRAEVDRLEAAGRVVDELRRARAAADAELDRAVAAHDAASGALRERRALIARAEDEQRRHDDLSAATAVAAERMAPAQARADRARAELEAAEERVSRARARLDAVRAEEERARRRADLEGIERLLRTLETLGEELRGKEADLAAIAVPDGAVEACRRAEDALRQAVARSAASAPRVEIAGEGDVRVAGESLDAGTGWTRDIVEETVFEVGTVSLTVVPAGDTEAVRREENAARAERDRLLADLGVDSVEEADLRARRAEGLRAEVAALRRRRADLLGADTPQDLEDRRADLRALLADAPEPAAEEEGGPAAPDADGAGDPAEETANAEQALARCRADDRAADVEAATLRTEHATKAALAAEAAGRLGECRDALSAAREAVSDRDLEEAEAETREHAQSARDKAQQARAALEDALADAPPDLLENARASLATLAAEERDSAAAVATALGRVNAIGDQGRLEAVATAERELNAAERENAALWRRARAADLLHRTLVARRSEALLAYQEPFHRAVVELGSLVYGRDFDVRLGEDLTILSRRIGDVTVDYESLSGGAREQLAVIVRIACARLVGDDGVPVFLDDTMGYTDPTRRLTMGAVIAAAAATSQVIVLTCDRARFAGIGGARTHVMQRSGASNG